MSDGLSLFFHHCLSPGRKELYELQAEGPASPWAPLSCEASRGQTQHKPAGRCPSETQCRRLSQLTSPTEISPASVWQQGDILFADTDTESHLGVSSKKQWVSGSSDDEAQWAEQWKNSPFWAPQIEKELNPTADRYWAAFVWTVSSVLELRGSGSQNASSDLSLSFREESFPVAERGGALRESANIPHTHTHTRAVGSAVISLTPHYSPAPSAWVWCVHNRGIRFRNKTCCSMVVCSEYRGRKKIKLGKWQCVLI